MENLKRIILEKRELKGVDGAFLDNFLEEYRLKNPKKFEILKKKKYNKKSKEFDEIKKAIRKKMRTVHGVFAKNQINPKKKKEVSFYAEERRRRRKKRNYKKNTPKPPIYI